MPDITYLHISGVLSEDGTYRARPGYESPRRGQQQLEGNPAFRLVLLDRTDRVLLSVAPRVTPRGCGSARDPQEQGVRGVLPLHPHATAYELRQGDIRLHRAAIPATPPKIAQLTCHEGAGALRLQWHSVEPTREPPEDVGGSGRQDPPGSPVTYAAVVAMESGRRITIARGTTDLSLTVDLSVLPESGKGTVYLVANDGVRSSEAKATTIDVPARPPSLHILVPGPKSPSLPFGQVLSMLGCCVDMGGQPCPPEHIVWYLDGEPIASGTLLAAHEDLQPGPHRLSLGYEPPNSERVETSVRFHVDEPDEHYRLWHALVGPAPGKAGDGQPGVPLPYARSITS